MNVLKMTLHAPEGTIKRKSELEEYGVVSHNETYGYVSIATNEPKALLVDWLNLHSIQIITEPEPAYNGFDDMPIVSMGRLKRGKKGLKHQHFLSLVSPKLSIPRRPLMDLQVRQDIYEVITGAHVAEKKVTMSDHKEWCSISILYSDDYITPISISAVRFWKGIAISTFESLCRCENYMMPGSEWLKRYGITEEALKMAPPLDYVVEQFSQFVKVAPRLVGYELNRYHTTLGYSLQGVELKQDVSEEIAKRKLKGGLRAISKRRGIKPPRRGLPSTQYAMLTAHLSMSLNDYS